MPAFSAPVDGSNTATIDENSPGGTSVFDVTYADEDSDPLTLTILSQSGGTNFMLTNSQLQVAGGAALDFESGTKTYTVQFQ